MEGNPTYDSLIKKWDDSVKNFDAAKWKKESAEWKKKAAEARKAGQPFQNGPQRMIHGRKPSAGKFVSCPR